MFPYLFTFSISLLLLQLSNWIRLKCIKDIFVLFAISFAALLAGLRDFSIGTDTETYISYWHITCYPWKWNDYWMFFSDGALEKLYLFYAFLISKITYNDQYFLFFTQLLILLPIVVATRKVQLNIVWVVFIYFSILFNTSLNATRQVIAISFCLLSLAYMLKREYVGMIFTFIIAYGFHNSAILYSVFILLYFMIDKYVFVTKNIVKFLIFVAIILLFTIFTPIWLYFAGNFMGGGYESYASEGQFGAKFPIALFSLSVFNAVLYFIIRSKNRTDKMLCLFDYFVYMCPAVCFSGLVSKFAVRIVYYPLFMFVLIFPYLQKNYIVPKWVKIVILVAYVVYFILTSVPYKMYSL